MKMRSTKLKKLLLLLFFVCSFTAHLMSQSPVPTRSDTIDIKSTSINLNITDFTGKTISGNAKIDFTVLMNNISQLDLDLFKFKIDSVMMNNQSLVFSYNDSITIHIQLPGTMNQNDSASVTVFYHGKPQIDQPSGWGGFYFTGAYAFNLGVGFSANPHPFGRAWFPCFDNFVERSVYHFSITCDSAKQAMCNGQLEGIINHGDGTSTFSWNMPQQIPSYLACVAVGPYTPVHFTYNSIDGPIEINLAAAKTDTINMKNSFVHLGDAIDAFETAYGPYRWNKVGYSLVPFSGGAMEHATNISYPLVCANGGLSYETIMAHELSHHWFGDLITCRTPEDMWINEGFASYNERVFLDYVYGYDAYINSIKSNHLSVVQYAHVTDSAYLSVSGIPHNYTYGTTVYDKGADVIHTLRTYMGDSLFFSGLTDFLNNNQYKDVSSTDLENGLSASSGIDLSSFFNDWIYSPGFPQFSIDSIQTFAANGGYDVAVYVKQRLDHAPHYYTNVPLEITFMDDQWNADVKKVWMSGSCGVFYTHLNFNPTFAGMDVNDKISDAITDDAFVIKTTGGKAFTNGKMTVNVLNVGADSMYLRIEHSFVRPDAMKTPIPNLHLSDYRYWKVDGIIPTAFSATSIINYNAYTSTSGGYLDNTFITNVEDSLVVMYRRNAAADWSIDHNVVQNMTGSHTDGKGYFTINNLQAGEYTLGIFDFDKVDTPYPPADSCIVLSVQPEPVSKSAFTVYPNPTENIFNVAYNFSNLNQSHFPVLMKVMDTTGKEIFEKNIYNIKGVVPIDTRQWPAGIYFVICNMEDKQMQAQKIIVIK